jgi:hypothetical protein
MKMSQIQTCPQSLPIKLVQTMLSMLKLLLLVLVPFIYAKNILPDPEAPYPIPFNTTLLANAPAKLYENDKYNFGRFKKPIRTPNLHKLTKVQTLVQKKEWHFISLYDGQNFFGLAVGQLNYMATAFVYVLGENGGEKINAMRPLGMGATFSPSSVSGCSEWHTTMAPKLRIILCNTENNTHVEVETTLNSGWFLKIDAMIDTRTESLTLAYPVGEHRPGYTTKTSGMPVSGYYKLGNKKTTFGENSVALMDWTRSLAARVTIWYWVALNFVSNGKRIGINLSRFVYDYKKDNQTLGLESAIWVDGKVHLVESELLVDGEPGNGVVKIGKKWHCHTKDGSLKLSYVPVDASVSETNIGVLNAKLFHTFGVYNGHVYVDGVKHNIENVKGILEDHWAKW